MNKKENKEENELQEFNWAKSTLLAQIEKCKNEVNLNYILLFQFRLLKKKFKFMNNQKLMKRHCKV